ncbi:GAF domain-containing SpoIIE family protein phosphatase [Rubellicoccus peritrichatus]|uniref:GAF domain-containing SpoIIE family protein phosphatase n=1 Tax=Rubellicoccus peritrichatus TaxID=3080537 RepID=A0AAQ3QTQ5_9BACT|nr:GAF domain-containing SpoIIE family protein phosphatase [Puniceicoccus sp. CR14]WOO41581.1 GAF domain-containing SpoIIE family protein phosphatase [Puniceicoccus sp. CR14]
MAGFIVVALLSAFAVGVWFLYLSSRREIIRLDEDRQLLRQEKQIVVEFMHNLVEAIGEGGDRQQLFHRVVHAAILSTGALSACVFEKTNDNKVRGVAVEGLFPPQTKLPQKSSEKLSTRAKFIEKILKSQSYDLGEGIIGSVAKSGEAVLIGDASTDPRVIQHDDASLKVRSLIVVPMMFRKDVIGVLAVANPADGTAFSETDFSLVESLAEQAAMAIHNSDLMRVQIEKNKLDFDISMASSIQGMILPKKFPDNPKVEIDAFYRPAQKIGGDLYDVFEIPGGKIGFAVADVSGKGISASLLMAICQTNLRRFAKEYESPSDVLRALNREVGPEMRQDMFVTFSYGVIDVEGETLTLARAGHELPMLLHRDVGSDKVTVDAIGSDGMAVGMVPSEIFDVVIEDKVIPFRSNDAIIFYTDGVTEAVNDDGVEFSDTRLKETIKTLRERSVKDMSAGIVASVERFTGQSVFADDLTLIAVRRL